MPPRERQTKEIQCHSWLSPSMRGLYETGFGRTWTSTGTFLGNVAQGSLSAGVGIPVIAATLLGSG